MNLKKPDIWLKCKTRLAENPKYKVESIAAKYGHIILRTAPYHPEVCNKFFMNICLFIYVQNLFSSIPLVRLSFKSNSINIPTFAYICCQMLMTKSQFLI